MSTGLARTFLRGNVESVRKGNGQEAMLKGWHLVCRVRHIVYSCVPRGDAKTMRLRAAVAAAGGLWREVAALSELDLARLVRADAVDILVDLTGHTTNNRLGAFAMRPAPLQVNLCVVNQVLACAAAHLVTKSPEEYTGDPKPSCPHRHSPCSAMRTLSQAVT